MIDERLKTRDENSSTSTPTKRHPEHREGSIKHLSSLSLSMGLLLISFLFLAACTDYVQKMDDGFDEWEQAQQQAELSSSSQVVKSSSSVKSSKSSSSVFLSGDSREKSSSSSKKAVSSSSSKKTSSSSAKATSSSEKKITSSSNYGSLKDDRDGQTYKTITIGNQTWMAENLNYEIENSYKSVCGITTAIHCAEYGKLYPWAIAMDSAGLFSKNAKGCGNKKTCNPSYPVRGICPVGWHIPEKKEFETLLTTIGGFSTAGIKLKTTDDWETNGKTYPGTDEYGFSAFPAGLRYDGSAYGLANNHAYFLTSTEYNDINEYTMQMHYNSADAEITPYFKIHAYSIRCIKDNISISSSSEENISSSSKNAHSSSSIKDSWVYLNPAISYGEMTDNRDGQIYKTVKIGEQTWMAENLNFETNNKSYCFNNEESNCAKYGRLYTWGTSMDSAGVYSNGGKGCGYKAECSPAYPVRGICPEGWHLPSKDDWEKIFDKLKNEREGDQAWLSTSEFDCHCGTDKYGLSILGSAGRDYSGNNFGGASRTAFFQTSSITSNTGTHSYTLYINAEPTNANVYASMTEDWSRLYAFSIRCLKNSSNTVLVSSSSAINEVSSSSMGVVPPCKTTTEDNCEYGELKDNRDGQIYKTVKIGNQWWMAENLNYNMANSLCYFDSVKYCAEWGRLYTWTTALQACPHGSHLPSRIEFETLFEAVGGQTTAGKMLKSVSGWSEKNGIDAYSFMALPVGYWDGGYGNAYTIFWSSTEYNDISAYYVLLYHTSDIVNVSNPHKTGAFSVRCIID